MTSRFLVLRHANMEQYENRLSVGQKALLTRKRAIIAWMYIRRAACALPQFVYDETKKNVTQARLIDDGNGVADARMVCRFQSQKTRWKFLEP